MRWPWQRESPQHRSGEQPGGPAAATPVAEPVPPSGWAFLPPLQRTIGTVRLTSDPGRFAGVLSSWSDPSFTGRMAHLVSAQAPPGVIDVDGGGPVPETGGYPAGSGEMTLLPPPAPRVRPAPGGHGASATTQRVALDGGPPARSLDGGAPARSLDGGPADGTSLLAADPASFPVLHVDPGPLQRSDSPLDAAPLTLARSLPDTEVTGPAAPRPEPEPSAPPPAPEAFWSRLPGESSPPRRGDSSTADGGATYVQIPSAPTVQRTSLAPGDSAPSFGRAPRGARLGLGMPLSFSDAGSEPPVPAESHPGHFSEPLPLPVQRSMAPDFPAAPPTPPAADGGDNIELETLGPAAGSGTDREVGTGSPTDSQMAGASGTDDDSVAEPGPRTQEVLPDAESGPEANAAVPTLSEDDTVPLLSEAGPAGTIEPAGGSHARGDDAPQAAGTGPALPVVSRLSVDHSTTDDRGAGRGPDAGESRLGKQAGAGSVAEPHGHSLVQRFVENSGDGPPNDLRIIEPVGPPTHAPGTVGADGAAPAASPLLQHSPALQHSPTPRSSPSLQRSVADGALAANGEPVEDHASPGKLSLPPRGPGGTGSVDGPLDNARADAGKPEAPAAAPSMLSSAPGVQRARASESPPEAREIPTSAGPVGLRVVRSGERESSPETWQRLTAMPVMAPIPTRHSVSGPATGMQPENPAAGMAWSGVGDTGIAAGPGSTHSDSGASATPVDRAAPPPDAQVGGAFDAATGASPVPSAEVGRAIQRTIALGAGLAESSARPTSSARPMTGPLSGRATGTGTSVPAPAGSVTPSLSLQRLGPHMAAIPASTRSTYSPWAPESGVPGRAPAGFLAGPAATVIESRPVSSPPLTLSLAAASPDRRQNQNVLQRDANVPPPDSETAAPTPPASPNSAPEGADGGTSVQGAEPVTAGHGLPEAAGRGQGPAGAAAPGGAAQPSPEQLEELAKRLAGPLIRRIKAEMLLDRERRGLRTDVN